MADQVDLDSPDNLNAFLRFMRTKLPGADAVSSTQTPSVLNPESPEFKPSSQSGEIKLEPGSDENAFATALSVEASPAPGFRAPPSTPLAQALSAEKTAQLDPIQEDGSDDTADTFSVTNNRHGRWGESKQSSPSKQVLAEKSPNSQATICSSFLGMTSTQRSLLGKKGWMEEQREHKVAELEKHTHGWVDSVIDTFRKSSKPQFVRADTQDSQRGGAAVKVGDGKAEVPDTVPFPEFDEGPFPESPANRSLFGKDTPASPTKEIFAAEEPVASPIPQSKEHMTTKEEDNGGEGVTIGQEGDDFNTLLKNSPSPTFMVTTSTDTGGSTKEEEEEEEKEKEEENREHLTHFKIWGTPTARSKPKSRVRSVILNGLPHTADFSLVQSLIHGGSIETMRLSPASSGRSTVAAFVTFTSAEACDRYFDNYPNGMDVRHQGKKYPVLVNKSANVDVLSGMMRGYLDCGATRVVKVSGADDEWGIVALNKLAQGRTQSRQVETVNDSYHNGQRTITFRFTNISDAVRFKGVLIRDDEWEGCPIEFAEDPCEKATGVHPD